MTDNGNGMKVIAILIFASITIFVISVVAVYVGDEKMHPSINSASVPQSRIN